MMRKRLLDQRGQSVMEYAVMFAAVVVVILVMQIYFKRAVQGRWKASSDQIGEQFTTGAFYTQQTRQQAVRQEATGQSFQLDRGEWTGSTVEANLPANLNIQQAGGKEAAYAGAEVTRTDFVVQQGQIGAGTIGTHGTMDSGIMSKQGLFKDDQ